MNPLKFILTLFLAFVFAGQSAFSLPGNNIKTVAVTASTEYAIFRVEYAVKKTGFEAKIYMDIGHSKNHSLKGIVENVDGTGIKVTKKDGSVEVVHSEIDLMNYLAEYGWKLKETYTIKIMSNEYQTYILVKE